MFWEPLGQRGCRGPVSSAGKEWTGLCRKGCPLRHTRGLGARTLNMLKNMVALVRDNNNKVIRRSSKTDREGTLKSLLGGSYAVSLTFLFGLCWYCLEITAQG